MNTSWTKWIFGAAAAAMVAVVGFNVPLSTVLLIGLVLMCPLMMLGMHGHGGNHSSSVRHPDSLETRREKDDDRLDIR